MSFSNHHRSSKYEFSAHMGLFLPNPHGMARGSAPLFVPNEQEMEGRQRCSSRPSAGQPLVAAPILLRRVLFLRRGRRRTDTGGSTGRTRRRVDRGIAAGLRIRACRAPRALRVRCAAHCSNRTVPHGRYRTGYKARGGWSGGKRRGVARGVELVGGTCRRSARLSSRSCRRTSGSPRRRSRSASASASRA